VTFAAHHLSKSKFLAGLHCSKRLWLVQNRPDRATPATGSDRVVREMGEAVGRLAHQLFPGGVPVDRAPGAFATAVGRTRELLLDETVPAIFEAAFEFEGVRIRVDVLERIGAKSWGLREVKAAARLKDSYLDDIAVQMFVLHGCGIDVQSAELMHIDTEFVRGDEEIAWVDFFSRADVTDAVEARQASVGAQVTAMHAVSDGTEPQIEPGMHCRRRRPCDFWRHCTQDKERDWIFNLPRLTRKQHDSLVELGVERIADIPSDFPLQRPQENARDAYGDTGDWVCRRLDEALEGSGPPAAYLDFETASPAVPIYAGTRPFQILPFQWSLHREDAAGGLHHASFLAEGDVDPRRTFAESLVAALCAGSEPIFVYSAFESRVLENLAAAFPDLRKQLIAVRARLVDLLPIVRNGVYHVGFGASFSIKHVAPALAPGFGYDDLDGVSEGGVAAATFQRIVELGPSSAAARDLRDQLLAYCAHDTLALVEILRALRSRVRMS